MDTHTLKRISIKMHKHALKIFHEGLYENIRCSRRDLKGTWVPFPQRERKSMSSKCLSRVVGSEGVVVSSVLVV